MAKVIIQYEAETASLKASVSEINKVNDEVVKSAQDSSKKVADAYKEAGNNAAKAFSGSELNKAFNQQAAAVDSLKQALNKLIQEEAKLVAEGKKQTDQYRQNQAELQKVKQGLDEVTKSTTKTSDGVKLLVRNSQDLAKFEDRLRELSIAGDRSSQEFNDLAKAIGEYRAGIIAADRAVDLYAKSTDAATGRIGELEDKLYDLALAGQTNSKEFRELVKEVAQVRRAVIETDAQVDALAQRGSQLTGFVQSVELVGNAFQAVEGAAALFGAENEELQQTLVRLQAIMAITSAIEQGRVIITEQLAARTGLASLATKVYTAATAGATAATRALNFAIASFGVGAILAAITGVVLAIKSFIDENARFEETIKSSNRVLLDSEKGLKAYADQYESLKNRIKVANGELSQEAADLNEDIQKTVNEAAKLLSPLIGEQRKLEAELSKTNNKIAFQQDVIDGLNKKVVKSDADVSALARAQKALNSETDKQNKLNIALTNNKNEQNKILETSVKIQNDLRKAFADEAAAKRREEAAKKAAEAAKKALEEQLRARERLAQLENEIFVNSLAERERLLSDSNAKIQELEKAFIESRFKANSQEAIQAEQQLAIAIETIKEETNKKIAEIDKRDIEEKLKLDLEAAQLSAGSTLQEQIKLLQTQRDLELAAADKLGKDKVEITKRYENQIAEIQKELAQSAFRVKIDLLLAEEAQLGSTLERRIKLIETQAAAEIKAVQDSTLENEEKASRIRRIEAETQKAIRDEQKKTADDAKKKRQEEIDQIFDFAKQIAAVFSQIGQLSAQLTENRIAGIQEAQSVELAAINNSVATERQKQREREALELRTSRRIAQEKIKQARLDKATALFGAVVSTAESIVKTGANLGYPAAIPFQVLAGVLGAAQIATIAARPIPKFEKGGAVGGKRHSQGGTLIEAEKDEFVTRRQQSIRHRAELEAINNSSATFNRLIEQRYVRPAIERYMLNSARQNLTVRASLNSKSMEKKLDKMSKSMRQPVIVNINGKDNRYTWQ